MFDLSGTLRSLSLTVSASPDLRGISSHVFAEQVVGVRSVRSWRRSASERIPAISEQVRSRAGERRRSRPQSDHWCARQFPGTSICWGPQVKPGTARQTPSASTSSALSARSEALAGGGRSARGNRLHEFIDCRAWRFGRRQCRIALRRLDGVLASTCTQNPSSSNMLSAVRATRLVHPVKGLRAVKLDYSERAQTSR